MIRTNLKRFARLTTSQAIPDGGWVAQVEVVNPRYPDLEDTILTLVGAGREDTMYGMARRLSMFGIEAEDIEL